MECTRSQCVERSVACERFPGSLITRTRRRSSTVDSRSVVCSGVDNLACRSFQSPRSPVITPRRHVLRPLLYSQLFLCENEGRSPKDSMLLICDCSRCRREFRCIGEMMVDRWSASPVAVPECRICFDRRTLFQVFWSRCMSSGVGSNVGSDGVLTLAWVFIWVYSTTAMLMYLWQAQNEIERQKRLQQITRRPL
jgi:hypothetical protein